MVQVQSFIGETRVLEITEEDLAETEIDGFDHSVQTVFCGNTAGDCFIQATESSLRLVPPHALSLLFFITLKPRVE